MEVLFCTYEYDLKKRALSAQQYFWNTNRVVRRTTTRVGVKQEVGSSTVTTPLSVQRGVISNF